MKPAFSRTTLIAMLPRVVDDMTFRGSYLHNLVCATAALTREPVPAAVMT